MPRLSPFSAAVAALALAVHASAPASATAQHAPTDARQLRVDSIFAQYDRADSPGCAVGIFQRGALAYARGYGMADLERRVPITARTIFDLGSTSKQFAAATIVLLAEEGVLSLDDDVRRWVPELPEYGSPITIRHLLHHTSGLRDYIGLLTMAGERIDDVTTPDEALAIIARQRELNFEPGAEHLYSNSGYFLLSIIVERAAGRSLRDVARERIFTPLGMTATHYLGSYDDVVPDRALAYAPRPGGGYRTDMSRWLQLGDGAVFSNVEELLAWDTNFYEPRVGGERMLAALHATGTLTDGSALGYALGLMVGEFRGQRIVSHGGAWGGYRAELLRFPEQRLSVATLCNVASSNPSLLSRRVAEVYLADVLASAPPPPVAANDGAAAPAANVPEATLRALTGSYRHAPTNTLRTIEFDGGVLRLAVGAQRFPLRARDARTFEVLNAPSRVTLVFEDGTSAGGPPARMRWMGDGPGLVLERIEIVTPTAAELAAYAGRYHSAELDAVYELRVEQDTLRVHRRSTSGEMLTPVTHDEFTRGPMAMRFTRDASGAITGFTLGAGRIRNVRFEKVATVPR